MLPKYELPAPFVKAVEASVEMVGLADDVVVYREL